MRVDRLALPLQFTGDVENRIEGGEVLVGADASLFAEMALNEVRLGGHVFVHVAPAVFLHDMIEYPERDVVVGRIGGDDLALEVGLGKINRRIRHVGGGDFLGVVHV